MRDNTKDIRNFNHDKKASLLGREGKENNTRVLFLGILVTS